jgi:hypothetical protein
VHSTQPRRLVNNSGISFSTYLSGFFSPIFEKRRLISSSSFGYLQSKVMCSVAEECDLSNTEA